MKAIIIEDEKLSAEHLETLLTRIDSSIEVVATLDSVKKSLAFFQKGIHADLLFVDIHLADGLSFEIFSSQAIDTPVIFTTAYDEYAIEAFKTNSIGYLLKPIGIEELREALIKHKKMSSIYQKHILTDLSQVYQSITKQYKNRFLVKMGDSISSVKSDEIAHFISEDGLVLLSTITGKRYPIDHTLDQLEEILDPTSFFRINRKVIVQINSIQKVNSYFNSRLKLGTNELAEDDRIVSRERVNDFKKWLDK